MYAQSGDRRPSLEKLVQSGAQMREPMPLSKLQRLVDEKNERLLALEEPPLGLDEAIAARL